MMTTAHPDDENNAMLAYLRARQGLSRTSLVTATRGEGGQNEIGPELFEALAVLRTEELLAAHRFDGAEQYFTRAVDFGFSFSVEETLEKWGHAGDPRRLRPHDSHDPSRRDRRLRVRRRRRRPASPDLVAADAPRRFARRPIRAQFPEQIKEGLRPWQAKKFYYTAGLRRPGGRPARAARR